MSSLETSKFAKRLAANEQPERNRAIKKLRKYIAAKTAKVGGFSQEELLQLWKGLHYCFWMQDKPLLQEELSAKLCGLLNTFPDVDSALKFASAFFTTEAKEWGRLDQWRMNKFMMLIRDFLNATLKVVKRNQWQETAVKSLSALIGDVMDAGKEDLPDGFRLHLADIYLEEIERVGAQELNGDQINVLLEPFVWYIVHSKRDTIADSIMKKVFGTILDVNGAPKLQFNYRGLQETLFDAGRQKTVLPKVRRKLYKLVKRFSELGLEGTQLPSSTGKPKMLEGKRKHTEKDGGEPETKKRADLKPEAQPRSAKKQKEETKKETPITCSSIQETPQSTPKHVAFDFQRNSSRGLTEFVLSSTSGSSPFLPSRSPSQGILKASPGITPSTTTMTTSEKHYQKRQKHFSKGQSLKGQWVVIQTEEKFATKDLKGKTFRGEKPSKFTSRKRDRVMKKPKRR